MLNDSLPKTSILNSKRNKSGKRLYYPNLRDVPKQEGCRLFSAFFFPTLELVLTDVSSREISINREVASIRQGF